MHTSVNTINPKKKIASLVARSKFPNVMGETSHTFFYTEKEAASNESYGFIPC